MSAGRSGKRVADIGPARLALLNTGAVEATTLTECLAVDFAALMHAALPEIGEDARAAMQHAAGEGISRRMTLAARLIHERYGMAALDELRSHTSDTVRGWACFTIGAAENMTLADRIAAIRPFADDPHFGVREWSWMAVRPHIAADLDNALELLSGWTAEASERLRRFASEATRPRGVWCAHLGPLRRSPEMALPLLEALQADPAPYVQDSVGNWLNDASKDRPAWVQSLCARWSVESPTPATARICKRALRSITRKG
ncbi:3-methyladenine DNA glycosylase AlkC [Deinobacterium chartae]|uniref:3-methyladenine DNA glycosylase AlkC n=1 Tax=Deinobacterium chartae TaxID=521158 RepID=A0A841I246_9DEIO|nr:DNA alkylation repair protein [Deinobacterium chartae]MBB6098408.1 3-methyladenine DNA glycosylase AlkC [Deinobacterium chartae]